MSRVSIPLPLGGVSRSASLERQPQGTVPVFQNMRVEDPATGRVRLASREGTVKHNTTRISASKIQHATAVTFDRRTVAFSNRTTDNEGDLSRWETATPSKKDCWNGVVDRQGNTWAIDGNAGLVKYNGAGAETFRVPLPVQDDAHVVREIEIDEFDRLFVGVSSGGDMEKAALWCYVPDDDSGLRKLWQLDTKLYVEQIVFQDGRLYVALSDPIGARGYARIYEDVGSAGPALTWSKQIAYPIAGIATDKDGHVFTTHPAVPQGRNVDPRVPYSSSIFDDPRWTPWNNLTRFEERIWGAWRAGDITKQFGFEDTKDGSKIGEWRSSYGRGISLYADTSTPTGGGSFKTPTYREHSLGFKPCVRLDGNYFRFITDPSSGNTNSANEVNTTLLPGKSKGYVIFLLAKVSEESAKPGRLFSQYNSNTTGTREAYVNTGAGGTGNSSGKVAVNNTPVSGTDARTKLGQFDNKNSVMLLTILCDNASLGSGSDFSVWRVNGTPIAKWKQSAFWTDSGRRAYIGCKDDGSMGPVLDIAEMWVFQSYTNDNGDEQVMTCPAYDANDAGVNPAFDVTSDTEVEQMEGWLMASRGMAHLLDDGIGAADSVPTWDSEGGHSEYCHPFSLSPAAASSSGAPPNPNGKNADTIERDLIYTGSISVALSNRGAMLAVSRASGQGSGIVCDSADGVYTVGARASGAVSGANANTLRKQTFNGTSFSIKWQKTFLDSFGDAVDYAYDRARLAVDEFDNLYVPFHWDDAATPYSMLVYTSDGTQLLAYAADHTQPAHSVKIDTRTPNYEDDTIARAEYVSLFTSNAGFRNRATVHRIRLVDTAQLTTALRATMALAVSNGDIWNFDAGSTTNKISQTLTSLSATAKYISSATYGGRAYFTDGISYRLVDPKRNLAGEWASTTAGELPPRAALLCPWRGRMVLARFDGEPQNVFMTEQGNPTGCDLFPPTPTSKQAWMGNLSQGPGTVPDIVNALVPYDKERLIFGCDHSLHILHGDPMEGGVITLLSDITGMAFGKSWCKDAKGNLFFFGSRGGVWRMTLDGSLQKISSEVDFDLAQIDLSTYYPNLEWDEDYHALRVFFFPFGEGGALLTYWNWSDKTGAWSTDTYSNANLQPTAAFVMDGDLPADRVLIVGREDGYMARFSRTATADDGYPIDAKVLIGAFTSPGERLRVGNVAVQLASDQGGATCDLLSSDTADGPRDVVDSWPIGPGESGIQFGHAAGGACWLQVRSATVGQRFAIERIELDRQFIGRRMATR